MSTKTEKTGGKGAGASVAAPKSAVKNALKKSGAKSKTEVEKPAKAAAAKATKAAAAKSEPAAKAAKTAPGKAQTSPVKTPAVKTPAAKEKASAIKAKAPAAKKTAAATSPAAKTKTTTSKKSAAKTTKTKATGTEADSAPGTPYPILDPILDPIGDTTDGEAQRYIPEAAEPGSAAAIDAYLADTSDEAEPDEDEEEDDDEDQDENEEDADHEEREKAPRPPVKLERLQKILSQAGVASRRHAEELIEAGRVMVNGKVITKLGEKADANRDHIRVDGKMLQGAERHRYFVLNKPKGYVTTVSDPEGRATVMEFFANMGERLYPVGRLDYQSEGLLLMTNDGALANQLTKAASGVEKTYLVKVAGQPTEQELEILRGGVAIERGKPGSPKVRTAPAAVRQVRQGDNPWFEVVLIEGRNRELRKMFSAIGHFVEKIRRVGYGPLILDQEPGKFRELDAEELSALKLTAEGKLKPKRTRSLIISEEIRPSAERYDRSPGREARSGARPEGRPFARRDDRRSGPPSGRPPYSKPQGDRRQPFSRPEGAAPASRPAPWAKPAFDRPARPQGDRPGGPRTFDRPAFDRSGSNRPGSEGTGTGRPPFRPRPGGAGPSRPGSDRPNNFRPRPDGDGSGRPPFRPRPEGADRSFDRSSGPKPRFDRPGPSGGPRGEGAPRFEQRPPFRPRPDGAGPGRPPSDRPNNFRPRLDGPGVGRPPFRPRPESAGRSFDRPAGPPRFDKPSGVPRFDRPSRPGPSRSDFDRGPQKSFGSKPAGRFDKASGKTWDKGPSGPPRPEGSRPAFGSGGTGRPPASNGRPKPAFGDRPGGGKTGGFLKSGYRPGGAKRSGSRPGAPKSSFKRPGGGGKKRG